MTNNKTDHIYTITIKNQETESTETHNITAFNPDGALYKLKRLLIHQQKSIELFKILKVLEI